MKTNSLTIAIKNVINEMNMSMTFFASILAFLLLASCDCQYEEISMTTISSQCNYSCYYQIGGDEGHGTLSMSYDTKDRLISTNRDGRKAVFFQYDAQGTSLDATDMESQKKTVVTINDRSLPLTVEDISIRYDFDDDGNLHRIYMVNGKGDLTTFAFKYSQDIVPVEFRHVAYSPLLFCHIVDSNIGTLLSNFQFANMPQTCEVMLRTIHGDTESYTLSYRLEDNVLNTTLYRDVKDSGMTTGRQLTAFCSYSK